MAVEDVEGKNDKKRWLRTEELLFEVSASANSLFDAALFGWNFRDRRHHGFVRVC